MLSARFNAGLADLTAESTKISGIHNSSSGWRARGDGGQDCKAPRHLAAHDHAVEAQTPRLQSAAQTWAPEAGRSGGREPLSALSSIHPSLLLDLPHRQFVFAISKALRLFFRHDRRLYPEVCRIVYRLMDDGNGNRPSEVRLHAAMEPAFPRDRARRWIR